MQPENPRPQEANDKPISGKGLAGWFSRKESAELSIPQKASLLLGFIYLVGYLITQIFTRSLGIETLNFSKPQFIESGLVFTVLTMTLIFLPFGMYDLIRSMRSVLNLPRSGVWRTFFVSTNYCLVLLFFALFITKYETRLPAKFFFGLATLESSFFYYLLAVLAGLFIASESEKGVVFLKHRFFPQFAPHHATAFVLIEKCISKVVSLIRWLLVLFSIYFDIFLLVTVHWAREALWAMRYYLLLVGMLLYIIFQTRRNLRQMSDEKLRVQMFLVSGIFVVVILYLTVTAYSYTVYRTIPNSRGGKLPTVQAILELNSNVAAIYPEIISTKGHNQTKPLFLMEQGEQGIYAITNYDPFDELQFNHVYNFKKEEIISIGYEPCDVRAPR